MYVCVCVCVCVLATAPVIFAAYAAQSLFSRAAGAGGSGSGSSSGSAAATAAVMSSPKHGATAAPAAAAAPTRSGLVPTKLKFKANFPLAGAFTLSGIQLEVAAASPASTIPAVASTELAAALVSSSSLTPAP